MKKFNCPACNKELIRLEPFEPGIYTFWCDDCNIDITVTKNMGNESIEEIVGNIKYLLKEAEESSENSACGYDEGWYNGECNAYEIVLKMLEGLTR